MKPYFRSPSWEREAEEWREAAIEALARALYRADGFRRGSITPRWEMTDRVIVGAWRKAARRYVDGGRIRRPRLVMVEDRWEDRSDDR